ncbi:MAG: DUF960 domain-containing protein [Caloramator sp.]|nr:DUF960 domain-containing protein [Caloramator sp.]
MNKDKLKNTYITIGIKQTIPNDLQMLLLDLYNSLEGEKDYLQVYNLNKEIQDDKLFQRIIHKQETPKYNVEYILEYNNAVDAKVFLIEEGEYLVMMLADEY